MPRLSRSPPVSPRLAREAVSCSSLQTLQHCSGSTPSLSVDPTHRHRGHTFTRNYRTCHGGGEGNITRSLLYFVHKKNQSFKKCEFWSSRARHSPALAYQQTGQWRATLEIKLAPAINTAPTTSNHHQHCIGVDISISELNYLFTSVSKWYVHCPH